MEVCVCGGGGGWGGETREALRETPTPKEPREGEGK